MPGVGPQRHDARPHLIAPRACRKTSLPASHHCCPGGSQPSRRAIDLAKIVPSTADAATNFLPRWATPRRLPRPSQPRRKTLPHQIPIDGRLLTQPPRVPSLKAFRRRPSQHRWIGRDGPASETLHMKTSSDRESRAAAFVRSRDLGRAPGNDGVAPKAVVEMPTASQFRSTLGGHDRSLADRAGAPRSATPPYPSDPAAGLTATVAPCRHPLQ